ncbi:sigma-70 family RNA polymerase sigma factor [Kiritimatiellota bacterium B12222]|nr:sigma-70 family RNA polymerase sigma factor [Kiritimatiellota bacterium B12222]
MSSDRFQTTNWSLVLAARGPSREADVALEDLCEKYWKPLYRFALQLGCPPEEAEDRVQSFFLQVLRKELFHKACPQKGKLRSFLLTAFRRHVQDEWTATNALKRGGDVEKVPFDEAWQSDSRLEKGEAFDREWARCILELALTRLKSRYGLEGKAELFDALRPYLSGDRPEAGWQAVADEVGMSAGALKVALHRLRKRFAEALREEVLETLGEEEGLEEELHYLLRVLGRNGGSDFD